MSTYRLPFGGYTGDPNEYGKAWKELGQKAEAFFEGYEVTGYDPFVRLDKKNKTPQDYWKTTSFDLTPEAIQALRAPTT